MDRVISEIIFTIGYKLIEMYLSALGMSRDKNMTFLKPVVFIVYRSDDNEESLRKRFVTYEEATMPIIR